MKPHSKIGTPCSGCDEPVPQDAPDGLCPRCVSRGLLDFLNHSADLPDPPLEILETSIPHYKVLGLLGSGGMGAVYKARQIRLGRDVAIKVFPQSPDGNPEFAERFRQEAQAMAQLSHPNIVTVYDFGETSEGCPYFTMEYVNGTDLAELIRSHPTPAQALAIVPQICAGLQYAHEQRIVHRDIKPSNILVDRNGVVKIADFGLARLFDEDHTGSFSLTRTGSAVGTPDYIAPEQLKGEAADHRVDIYSLGVVIYELLTGDLPKGVFDLPSQKRSEVDARFDDIVRKAMQEKPERRYQAASEVRTQVVLIQDSKARKPKTSKLFLRVALAACLTITAIGAGLAYYFDAADKFRASGLFWNWSEPEPADHLSADQPPNLPAAKDAVRTPATPTDQRRAAALVQSMSTDDRSKLLEFLNSATLSRLKDIPGIGDGIAANIVKGRPYQNVEDLVNISGIGEKKFIAVVKHAGKS